MVQAAAEGYSYLLLGEAKDSDLPKPQDAERSWRAGRKGRPARWRRHGEEGGVRVRVGVLISFSCLTSSLWQADGCTLNTTLLLASRKVAVHLVVVQRVCIFFFPLQNVEVVEGHTKQKSRLKYHMI